MKRILTLTMALAATLTMVAGEHLVDFSRLPQRAQNFIKEHFAQQKPTHIIYDSELLDGDFEVFFADGTQLDFNKRGEWRKMERKGGVLPMSSLPEAIANHITTNHPEVGVVEIDRDRNEYEVKLSSGVELVFNHKGRLKWYD